MKDKSIVELMIKVRKGIVKYEELTDFEKWEYQVYISAYEKRKEYYQKNKDKFNKAQLKWRKKNPEKVAEYTKNWISKNKEKWNSYQKNWKKNNPEKVLEHKKKHEESRLLKLAEAKEKFFAYYQTIRGLPNEKELMEAYVIK